jgi:hypothetical protein
VATIAEFRRKFNAFHSTLNDAVSSEAAQTSDVILALNRDQMLYGRDALGNVLKPDYLDDPYFQKFKDPLKKAVQYKKMKIALEDLHYNRIGFQSIQLFPDKSPDTPNLLVNGNWFMNYLFINISKEGYEVSSTGQVTSDIEQKYGKVFGLAPASKTYYWNGFLRRALLEHYEKIMAK